MRSVPEFAPRLASRYSRLGIAIRYAVLQLASVSCVKTPLGRCSCRRQMQSYCPNTKRLDKAGEPANLPVGLDNRRFPFSTPRSRQSWHRIDFSTATFLSDDPANGTGQRRISAPYGFSELFWKPSSQNGLPVMGLENPLAAGWVQRLICE